MQGEDEFLGKARSIPTVRLTLDTPSPSLDWCEIVRYTTPAGELLAAFELLLDEGGELPFTPPKASPPHIHYIVPSGIRPVLQKTRVEVSQFLFYLGMLLVGRREAKHCYCSMKLTHTETHT